MPDTIPFAATNALALIEGLDPQARRVALERAIRAHADAIGADPVAVAREIADAIEDGAGISCRTCDDTRVIVETEPGGDGVYRHTYPCPDCTARDDEAQARAIDALCERLSIRWGRCAVSRPDDDGTVAVQGMIDDVEMGPRYSVRFDGVITPSLDSDRPSA
jgi:hypothetical protein